MLRRFSMDLTRPEINRRTALLTSAAIAANVVNPMRAFAQETPRKGGVFNVHYGAEQRQLNPSIQASTGVYIIGGKIQENLVDLDASGQPVGVLAESWEASPDGKTVIFKLRKGVTWHDGKPFTSADVEFTAMNMWKKILNYGSTLHSSSPPSTPRIRRPPFSATSGRCRSICCCVRCRTSAMS